MVFEKRVFGIRFRLFRSLTISAIDLVEERGEIRIRRTREGNVVMSVLVFDKFNASTLVRPSGPTLRILRGGEVYERMRRAARTLASLLRSHDTYVRDVTVTTASTC